MTNKQMMMSRLMKQVYSLYVIPTLSKGSDIRVEPIKVNAALYENDYVEYIASKVGKVKHINSRKDD
jgi:hypothetical protein